MTLEDSSPYFAVHQVVPGDHVQETVQGELVSEQLENTITRKMNECNKKNNKTVKAESSPLK